MLQVLEPPSPDEGFLAIYRDLDCSQGNILQALNLDFTRRCMGEVAGQG
jgi:hypothetical protein